MTPSGNYNESAYENAVIEVLKNAKWEHTYGPDIDDRDYHDPVLNDVFQYQLRRLNRDVPDDAITAAFHKVKEIVSGNLVERNRIFTDYLQNGVEVSSDGSDGEENHIVYLADYKKPQNNTFQVVNQFTLVGKSERIPDVVLFVNGLPLVVIELKNPSNPETTFHDAYLMSLPALSGVRT